MRERLASPSTKKNTLVPRTRHKRTNLPTADVEVHSLDYLVAANDLRGTFGLKIDTEGFEMSVIRGATKTLKQSAFVIAEVSMKERFAGGYTFRQFINEMAIHGFEAVDILSFPRHSNYFDILFLPHR